MAVHADSGVGNGGMGGLLDTEVAVAAVDTKPRHMVLMGELDRLNNKVSLFGDPRGPVPEAGGSHGKCPESHHADNEHPNLDVRVAMEDLSQLLAPSVLE